MIFLQNCKNKQVKLIYGKFTLLKMLNLECMRIIVTFGDCSYFDLDLIKL